jgi:hypothetical protein
MQVRHQMAEFWMSHHGMGNVLKAMQCREHACMKLMLCVYLAQCHVHSDQPAT